MRASSSSVRLTPHFLCDVLATNLPKGEKETYRPTRFAPSIDQMKRSSTLVSMLGWFLPSFCQAFSTSRGKLQSNPILSRDYNKPSTLFRRVVGLHESSQPKGDRFREATGIRPSLHPTTINAIAEALKIRASNDPARPLRINDSVKPLDVALSAGKIAATVIDQRQATSAKDNMQFTPEESQTVAGRVLGVVMRLDELERILYEKVSAATLVQKYNAWDSFGVLSNEGQGGLVDNRIKDDPLFRMNRSECLLALFLTIVEAPQLAKISQSVPDESVVNFLDSDRLEVIAADAV